MKRFAASPMRPEYRCPRVPSWNWLNRNRTGVNSAGVPTVMGGGCTFADGRMFVLCTAGLVALGIAR
jgi:hypothetical protein